MKAMLDIRSFFVYLIIMASVTYLIRALPFVICKGKIENKFVQSFLFYVPYAVLGAMTFPAIIFSTGNIYSAAAGLIVGGILAFREKSLITVAIFACVAAFIVNVAITML